VVLGTVPSEKICGGAGTIPKGGKRLDRDGTSGEGTVSEGKSVTIVA